MTLRPGWMHTPLAILLALVLLGLTANAQDEASSDEAAVEEYQPIEETKLEKMRVRQLRAFLDERAEACTGCVEKSHLLARAKELRLNPPQLSGEELAAFTASRKGARGSKKQQAKQRKTQQQAQASQVSFPHKWAELGASLCAEEHVRLAGRVAAGRDCDGFKAEVFEAFSGLSAGNLVSILGKSSGDVLAMSLKEPYHSVGLGHVRAAAGDYLQAVGEQPADDDKPAPEPAQAIRTKVMQWYLNTALGNADSMRKDMDLEAMLRQARATGSFNPPPPKPKAKARRKKKKGKKGSRKKKQQQEQAKEDL